MILTAYEMRVERGYVDRPFKKMLPEATINKCNTFRFEISYRLPDFDWL
jgi:hypothetical protein